MILIGVNKYTDFGILVDGEVYKKHGQNKLISLNTKYSDTLISENITTLLEDVVEVSV